MTRSSSKVASLQSQNSFCHDISCPLLIYYEDLLIVMFILLQLTRFSLGLLLIVRPSVSVTLEKQLDEIVPCQKTPRQRSPGSKGAQGCLVCPILYHILVIFLVRISILSNIFLHLETFLYLQLNTA